MFIRTKYNIGDNVYWKSSLCGKVIKIEINENNKIQYVIVSKMSQAYPYFRLCEEEINVVGSNYRIIKGLARFSGVKAYG